MVLISIIKGIPMRRKNLVYPLAILLLITCSFLYDKFMSKSTGMSSSVEISKWDFIAFPKEESKPKIYPLIRELNTNVDQKIIEKTPEVIDPVLETTILIPTPDTLFKLGDSGDEVKYIQHRLNEYGYKIEEDGVFKAITYDAILNFQYRCKLNIDGEVGSKTLEKLNIPPDKNIEFNTKVASILNGKNTTSNIH